VRALLRACHVIEAGGHINRDLGFQKEIEIVQKRRKLEIVNASHVKYYIIRHFAAFCGQFVPFSPKKTRKTQFYPEMA